MNNKPIYVTQPALPPLSDFVSYLEKIWESRLLTNGGPFHQELERALQEHLAVKQLSLFTNGTIALMTALQTLHISGEVITTPYSFVATAHSLLWRNIEPVFVDIDPANCNLDPACIEAVITPRTSAILAVHCYGIPCDVNAIENLADTYGLKVIYDAAHAFGVRDRGGSILRHGDLSVLSFHATKVFNTFEGGAIVCPDRKTKRRIDYLKNFGFADEVTVTAPGINGKMNEMQAALGLLQLNHMQSVIARREQIDRKYRAVLAQVPGISLLIVPEGIQWNHAYFPIFIESVGKRTRDGLYSFLRERGIFARRYFYPLITEFPMYRSVGAAQPSRLLHARRISDSVLCLPIYPDLTDEDQERIVGAVGSYFGLELLW